MRFLYVEVSDEAIRPAGVFDGKPTAPSQKCYVWAGGRFPVSDFNRSVDTVEGPLRPGRYLPSGEFLRLGKGGPLAGKVTFNAYGATLVPLEEALREMSGDKGLKLAAAG